MKSSRKNIESMPILRSDSTAIANNRSGIDWESEGKRFRDVALPEGLEQWYTPGFDPAAAGWRTGKAPPAGKK